LVSSRRHKHAHLGVLRLSARCTQTVAATLVGKVAAGKGAKTKRYVLPQVRRSLAAGRTVTLTMKLPKRALAALAHHTRETVSFKLAFYNANGARSVTVRAGVLKPAR